MFNQSIEDNEEYKKESDLDEGYGSEPENLSNLNSEDLDAELEALNRETQSYSSSSNESGSLTKSKDFNRFFDMVQSSASASSLSKSQIKYGGDHQNHLDQSIINKDLVNLQMEIYDTIKYENI